MTPINSIQAEFNRDENLILTYLSETFFFTELVKFLTNNHNLWDAINIKINGSKTLNLCKIIASHNTFSNEFFFWTGIKTCFYQQYRAFGFVPDLISYLIYKKAALAQVFD